MFNRVLSGLAEAAASGADEAIAYDALQARGLAGQWGRVLDRQMRLRSVFFILTMNVGAAVYDPSLMTRMAAAVGWPHVFTQAQTLRLPVYLTFILALLTLAAVLGLEETAPGGENHPDPATGGSVWSAFRLTLASGRWILKTPFVLMVILFGMLFDGILRMVVTLASQYYRMVQLPESSFGLMGSAMAVAGIFIPRICLWIAENRSPLFCLWSTTAAALVGLVGMTFFWPLVGLLPALVAFSAMYMVGFYVSYFINQKAASAQRATVLSFKGLAYNISYGIIGMVYAGLLEAKKSGVGTASRQALENAVFKDSFYWFPTALAVGLAVLASASFFIYRHRGMRR